MNNGGRHFTLVLGVLCISFIANSSHGRVYTCVGENGEKVFQDQPCDGGTDADYQARLMKNMSPEELIEYSDKIAREAEEAVSDLNRTAAITNMMVSGCSKIRDVSKTIMENRQQEIVSLSAQLSVLDDEALDPSMSSALRFVVNTAYEVPVYESPSLKDEAARQFSNIMHQKCVNEGARKLNSK